MPITNVFMAAGWTPAALDLPRSVDGSGLLVGWSMEHEHHKAPIGFSFGDPDSTPEKGFVDPILLDGEGHLITIAPTGAGKGVGCIVPALLRYLGSAIVIDPKGENAAITARWRRSAGQKVVVLDPMGLTGQEGGTLNPLDLIDPRTATGVDDAAALVSALLPASSDDGRNAFWVSRGRQLLLALVLHVVTDLPPEARTLTKVRELAAQLAGDPDAISRAFAASRHPEVRMIQGNLLISARETLGGIVAFVQDGVDFLRGPQLQEAVARTSFDLDAVVRGDPLTIYLVLPPHMLGSHGRFLRLWISTLLALIMRRRRRPERPTLFILDEAAQLGTLDELRTALTLLRGYGLQTWSFWQDLSQIRMLYPHDWQTMINNCAVLQSFGPNTQRAAAESTEVMGFMTASEFLALERDEMLLQIAGDEAVVARRPNYLTDPIFADRFDANPMFDAAIDPVPAKTLTRFYLRPARRVQPAATDTIDRLGPADVNSVDRALAELIGREVEG